jgi:hypothetical protein
MTPARRSSRQSELYPISAYTAIFGFEENAFCTSVELAAPMIPVSSFKTILTGMSRSTASTRPLSKNASMKMVCVRTARARGGRRCG